MKFFKATILACGVLTCSVPALADDVTSAFFPEEGPAIRMQGTLEGDEITCRESQRQDCQKIFESVVELFDDKDSDATVRGYVKRKNKRRQKLTFKLVSKRQHGVFTRMICEVDPSTGEVGMVWGDPSEKQ